MRKRIDAWLDKGMGSCHLRKPIIAEMVENALLHFDGNALSIDRVVHHA